MAYGIGGSDPFSAPMALAMGYGILFATPLTVILLPCLLLVQGDIKSITRGAIASVAAGGFVVDDALPGCPVFARYSA
jgi:hypothetical protein